VEEKIVYFERPGKSHTEETLRLAIERAQARGITTMIVASTVGDTARAAAVAVAGTGIRLVVVPHQFGFTETQRFPAELVAELEAQGHCVHFGTMLFHTENLYGSDTPLLMAMILRTLGQGIKVCVEIVLMAADGGRVARGEPVVVVSGTARGADTAVVATASTSTALHELHLTEIICKPLQTRSWKRGTSPYDHPTKPGETAGDDREL
jgi:uncharacterized protein